MIGINGEGGYLRVVSNVAEGAYCRLVIENDGDDLSGLGLPRIHELTAKYANDFWFDQEPTVEEMQQVLSHSDGRVTDPHKHVQKVGSESGGGEYEVDPETVLESMALRAFRTDVFRTLVERRGELAEEYPTVGDAKAFLSPDGK